MVAYASAKLAWREVREGRAIELTRIFMHLPLGGLAARPCVGVDKEGSGSFKFDVEPFVKHVLCLSFLAIWTTSWQAVQFGPTDIAKICCLPSWYDQLISVSDQSRLRLVGSSSKRECVDPRSPRVLVLQSVSFAYFVHFVYLTHRSYANRMEGSMRACS